MHHMRWSMHLLPALDALLALLAGGRADIVIEGRNYAGPCRLTNDIPTLRIIIAHDLFVVKEVEPPIGQRPVQTHLKPL